MSKRRSPGDVVACNPGRTFLGPHLKRVRIQLRDDGPHGWCLRGGEGDKCCHDPECREWDESLLLDGPSAGFWVSHLSECEMEDA